MFLSELEWVILTFPDLWQGSVRRLTRASSNSGKKSNVESQVALHEMDEGMPQSSHRDFGGKALSLDTQIKH